MTDYLAAEALLLARLSDQVPGVKAVLAAADLEGVEEAKQVTPALHLVFGGYRPLRQGQGAGGRLVETEQTWWVVVAVKNLRTAKTGTDARAEAGPLLAAVLGALLGWKPSPDHAPLELAPAPRGGFSKGFGYYPLAFVTRVIMRCNP